MNNHDRPDLYNRTLAVHQLMQPEQLDLQHLPPVSSSSAQEFARLMQRHGKPQQEAQEKEMPQRGLSWDRFKQGAFRFAGRILSAEKSHRKLDDGLVWKDLPDGGGSSASLDQDNDGRRMSARGLLMRLGTGMFRDRTASDLSHDLANAVRMADSFGRTWALSILLANEQLPETMLHIRCDDQTLHLNFACTDPRAAAILKNNRMLLLTRMGSVTSRIVLVEIDESAIPVQGGAAAGGQA